MAYPRGRRGCRERTNRKNIKIRQNRHVATKWKGGKTNAGLAQRNGVGKWKEGVIRKPGQPWWGLVMC